MPKATTFGGGRSKRTCGPKITNNENPGPGQYSSQADVIKPKGTAYGFKKDGTIESIKTKQTIQLRKLLMASNRMNMRR